jgi:hypothetical protein
MAKIKKPTVSPPAPFEQNTDQTTETEAIDTPDIQALRAYTPDMTILNAGLDAQFENARRNLTDSYGAYSGIPSQVVRNRLRDEGLADLEGKRSVALAEGSERAQALKMAQLEALAQLTGRTRTRQTGKNYGYNTSVLQPQGSNIAGSAISGGAGVAASVIPLL